MVSVDIDAIRARLRQNLDGLRLLGYLTLAMDVEALLAENERLEHLCQCNSDDLAFLDQIREDRARLTAEVERLQADVGALRAMFNRADSARQEAEAALAAANEDAKDWRRRWTAANERAEKLEEALGKIRDHAGTHTVMKDDPTRSYYGWGFVWDVAEEALRPAASPKSRCPDVIHSGTECYSIHPAATPEAKPLPLGHEFVPCDGWQKEYGDERCFLRYGEQSICGQLESAHR